MINEFTYAIISVFMQDKEIKEKLVAYFDNKDMAKEYCHKFNKINHDLKNYETYYVYDLLKGSALG